MRPFVWKINYFTLTPPGNWRKTMDKSHVWSKFASIITAIEGNRVISLLNTVLLFIAIASWISKFRAKFRWIFSYIQSLIESFVVPQISLSRETSNRCVEKPQRVDCPLLRRFSAISRRCFEHKFQETSFQYRYSDEELACVRAVRFFGARRYNWLILERFFDEIWKYCFPLSMPITYYWKLNTMIRRSHAL